MTVMTVMMKSGSFGKNKVTIGKVISPNTTEQQEAVDIINQEMEEKEERRKKR